MQSVDKNDVDISKLFEWGGELVIKDRNGDDKVKVYVRLNGDAEVNQARVYGLRKSAELRKKLRDMNSEERVAYIPAIETIDREIILETLVLFHAREATLDALQNIELPLPPEPPSDADLEEQEKYQAEVDNYPAMREKMIRELVEKKLSVIRKQYEKKSLEEMYKEYERYMINQICENEMVLAFREMLAYFGTYKDSAYRKPAFKDFERFHNLPKEVKEQIIDFYLTLEIGSDDLKKLPAPTQ
jgi:hypothetical protein